MKTYLWFGSIVLACVCLVGGYSSSAEAAPKAPVVHHATYHGSYHNNFYHNGHYHNFHYFPSHYHGWTRYCWFPTYHCYGYYDPNMACWYYWNTQYSCYMPVSYIATFAPTPVVVAPPMAINPVGSPGLPAGAVPVSPGAVPMP